MAQHHACVEACSDYGFHLKWK